MKDAFGVSKSGVGDLPKFLPKKATSKGAKMLAHEGSRNLRTDATIRQYGMSARHNRKGNVTKSAFLDDEIEKFDFKPFSMVGQAIHARKAAGAVRAIPTRPSGIPGNTSAARMKANRGQPAIPHPVSNTPTAAPSIHTAAASPSIAPAGKTVTVSAAKPPAAPKPPKKGGGKTGSRKSTTPSWIKPTLIAGGATAGVGAVGAGAYMAGRNK